MSNTKRTPGPWKVNETDYSNAYGIECEVNGVGHTVVTDQFCYPNFKKDRDPEKLANAKLIASSPELLAVCKDIIELWDECMPLDSATVNKAVSAYKKATE